MEMDMLDAVENNENLTNAKKMGGEIEFGGFFFTNIYDKLGRQ